ncbi:MAG: hypothetical protein AB2689_11115 [Candidatus Thiodiazotropha taylori]|nr:hypothetical protein [Candidatus Thiodiazotropha taylori]MCW4316765.1 hypothetical protein [Candidatus Thiodiazotropha taylori]
MNILKFLLFMCTFSLLSWDIDTKAALVEQEAVNYVRANGSGFIFNRYETKHYFWEKNESTGNYLKMYPDGHTIHEYSEHGVLLKRYDNGVMSSSPNSSYLEHDNKYVKVGTIGTEDRRLLTASEKQIPEYKRVGIIVGPTGEEGTGMVFGKQCEYVLTAAHTTWKNEGEGAQNILFNKNTSGFIFSNDPSGNGRISYGTVVYTGWPSKNQTEDVYDFAIVKLSPPAFSQTECKRLGKLRVKTWNSNNPKKVNCNGKLSMVAIYSEDPNNIRIDNEFYGQNYGVKSFQREDEMFQTDGDSNNMASGAPTWCHENNSIKLVGVFTNQIGYNPKEYKIDPYLGENPGFGEYDKDLRFSYHISVWSKMENLLRQYGGGDNFIVFED